ncbi:hypothetical protein EYR36_007575 [Pleurotus pulmonarius]|nr:hypothetical protein EYR36_007575 [Pleurotus pulmonarius]
MLSHQSTGEPGMPLSEAHIASRIASLREEIVVLSKCHNANYAATAKLPAEVLVMVFECLSRAPIPPRPPKSPKSPPYTLATPPPELTEPPRVHYTWIKEVTHVCSTWRFIALETPLLWTSALLRPKEWAEQVLRRALGAPVDLQFPEFTQNHAGALKETDTDLIRLAFSRPQNIRSVDISFASPMLNEAVTLINSLVAESPFPHLERLQFSSDRVQFEFPDELFSQSRLRHLSLQNCVVNLSTPRFLSLRTLRLETDLGSIGVLDGLSAMPELEELFLQDFGHSRDAIMKDTQEPFEMPMLREIALKSDYSQITDLFEVLIAPVIRSVVVETQSLTDVRRVLQVYSFLQIDHLPPTWSQALRLTDNEEDYRLLHSSTAPNGDSKTLSITGIGILLSRLWASIPKQNLQSFILISNTFDAPEPEPYMSRIITSVWHLPTLQTLQVPYTSFLAACKSNALTTPILPSLLSLTVESRIMTPGKASLERLKEWLERREDQGSPSIPHLRLTGCFGESDLALLRPLVGDWITVQVARLW